MTCREIEDLILESLEPPLAPDPAIAAHVAQCASCRAFEKTQMSLDAVLAVHYAAPQPAADFEGALRRRIAADRRRAFWEYVPDLLHLGGGLAASAACAWFMPQAAAQVLAIGGGVTVAAYFFQLVVRALIEQVEEG